MATFNKFNCFVGDVGLKLHNLNTDTLKVYLTNAAPAAGNTAYNVPADIGTQNGYTVGGAGVGNTFSQTGGVGTLGIGADIVWTATGGSVGPFRYAVLYNDTAAGKNLIGWWDYGSAITLLTGETFTFDMTTSLFTIT
jgi:hypothetical protein